MSIIYPANIIWRENQPYSKDYDDIYFSKENGIEETRYVFLQHNHLPERFAQTQAHPFTIVETGFGSGLNFFETLGLWQQYPQQQALHFISVEKHPVSIDDLQKIYADLPEYKTLLTHLIHNYPEFTGGFHHLDFSSWNASLSIFFGDISEFLNALTAPVDAWFLDGFSPQKNSLMWQDSLFKKMAELTQKQGTFSTFSSAGFIRRQLIEVGFSVIKNKGFGQKREMLSGVFDSPHKVIITPGITRKTKPWLARPRHTYKDKTACVLGAGISGLLTAYELAERGWQVTVLDALEDACQSASGNPAAVLYPNFAEASDNFLHQSWLYAQQFYSQINDDNIFINNGVLQICTPSKKHERMKKSANDYLLNANEASDIAGISIQYPALWQPLAGYLFPHKIRDFILQHKRITFKKNILVKDFFYHQDHWHIVDNHQQEIQQSSVLILANAYAVNQFKQTDFLKIRPVSGQVSIIKSNIISKKIKPVICHDGYLIPSYDKEHDCIGASFHPNKILGDCTLEDHIENKKLLVSALPDIEPALSNTNIWNGRMATRAQTDDYLPLVGPIANKEWFVKTYAEDLQQGRQKKLPLLNTIPGLFCQVGHGSKGFSQAPFSAYLLAQEINNEETVVSENILNSIHPMRFLARDLIQKKINDAE